MELQTKIGTALIIILWSFIPAQAQDMTTGFVQLEKGEFSKAKVFFGEILEQHPSNMTAQICHARALGLSGNATQALSTFESLSSQNPKNIEIQLNLAEAHLWNKDGDTALEVYSKITARTPNSFVAILGTANAHSMVKNYESAHKYILKALKLDPANDQAKISKKYIQLAYANQLASQEQQYEQALNLLDDNLHADTKDQESLALKANILIQSKSFKAGLQSFEQLDDAISGLIGQSLSYHFLKDDKEALELAALAITKADNQRDLVKAHSHYNQTLLWNENIKEAKTHYTRMSNMNFEANDLLLVNANIALNEADFAQAANAFQTILQRDSMAFNANLGLANAMHAMHLDRDAYKYAFMTQIYYPGQKDAENFVNKLNATHNATLKSGYQYELSSDGSYNKRWSIVSTFSLSPLNSVSINYTSSKLSNNQKNSLHDQRFSLSAKHQINGIFSIHAGYKFISIQGIDEPDRTKNSEIDMSLVTKLNKSQTLTVGVSTEVQDFNSALLAQNITSKSLFVKNSLFWKQNNFGIYSEFHVSQLTDKNRRLLSFNSIYKNVLSNPSIKVGINHLMIRFTDNTTAYFSPKSYQQFEVFGSISKSMNEDSRWAYGIDLAGGYQLSDGLEQFTWRTKCHLERKIKHIKIGISLSYSSIAAANNNGFSYLSTSAEITIPLTKRPYFYKKLKRSLLPK